MTKFDMREFDYVQIIGDILHSDRGYSKIEVEDILTRNKKEIVEGHTGGVNVYDMAKSLEEVKNPSQDENTITEELSNLNEYRRPF